jgi:S-methylmethionine-dependent homocysteine/selenocysteine methylase
MKLKKGFITHTIQGTQVMVAAGPVASIFKGIARSNETAAFIVDCLKQDTTEDGIVKKLTDTYEVDTDMAKTDVRAILDQLEQIGAIE